MLAFIFTYCSLDDYPIDQSRCYQRLVNLHGKEFADTFTYEKETVICSHPPPEVMEDGRYIGVISTAS